MPKRVIPTEKPDLSATLDMKVLGQFVRFKRTALDMTLEDAASLCGLSKQAYSNVEQGVETIRVDTLFKVISALGVKLKIDDAARSDDDWT